MVLFFSANKWGGILVDNKTKIAVPIKDIQEFNSKSYNPNKKYKFQHDGKLMQGFVKV